MNLLKILRGVSGSGKSTRAKELWKESTTKGEQAVVCSADKFFIDRASGEYKFDSRKLGEAHAWCKGTADMAMQLGVDLVIIDNTNLAKWEYQPYIELAEHYGYSFEEEVIGSFDENSLKEYANRNKHGVTIETIRKMAKKFQV